MARRCALRDGGAVVDIAGAIIADIAHLTARKAIPDIALIGAIVQPRPLITLQDLTIGVTGVGDDLKRAKTANFSVARWVRKGCGVGGRRVQMGGESG